MTQSPSPIVDEVETVIDAVMEAERYSPKTFAAAGGLPIFDGMQPDNDGPWVSRVDVAKRLRASLVSPPKAGSGEPELCKPYVKRNQPGHAMDGGEVVVPFRSDFEMECILAALANHEARGDGVRVTDEMVERAAKALRDDINRDDLPKGGWSELWRQAARAALEAALPPLGDGRAEIVEACARAAVLAIRDAAVMVPSGPFMDERLPSRPALCKIVRDAIRSLSNPGGSE